MKILKFTVIMYSLRNIIIIMESLIKLDNKA